MNAQIAVLNGTTLGQSDELKQLTATTTVILDYVEDLDGEPRFNRPKGDGTQS